MPGLRRHREMRRSVPSTAASAATSFTQAFSAISSLSSTLGGGDKSSENIAGTRRVVREVQGQGRHRPAQRAPLFKDRRDNASDYDDNDTASICIDKKSGWVLKLAATKKGVARGRPLATSVGDPSDSDFTPPVTPETVPTSPTSRSRT